KVVLLFEHWNDRRLHQRRLARARRPEHGGAAPGEDARRELRGHIIAPEKTVAIAGPVRPRARERIAAHRSPPSGAGASNGRASSCAASSSGASLRAAIRPVPGRPPPLVQIWLSIGSAFGSSSVRLSLGAGRRS